MHLGTFRVGEVYIFWESHIILWNSTVDLSYVVAVKSTVEILQTFVVLSEYINFIKSFSKFKESTFDGFGILSIYSGAFLNKSRLQGVLSSHSLFTFFLQKLWNSKTSITSSLRKLHWKIESIINYAYLKEPERKSWVLRKGMEVPTNKWSTFLLLSKNFEVNQ